MRLLEHIQPVVRRARFAGKFEGAEWLSFPASNYKDAVESGAFSKDPAKCAAWWVSNENTMWVGGGSSPNEALKDLVYKYAPSAEPKSLSHHELMEKALLDTVALLTSHLLLSDPNVSDQGASDLKNHESLVNDVVNEWSDLDISHMLQCVIQMFGFYVRESCDDNMELCLSKAQELSNKASKLIETLAGDK